MKPTTLSFLLLFAVVAAQFCTDDAKQCESGKFVGRDPENDCKFFPCEGESKNTTDANLDVDGSADPSPTPAPSPSGGGKAAQGGVVMAMALSLYILS